MYFVSMADNHNGKWIGGCYVNAPTQEEARDKAAALAPERHSCIAMSMVAVPAGPFGIPASLYGRLLNRADLESMGAVADFLVDDEGKVERLPMPS